MMVTAVRPVVETPDSTATSSTPEAADTTAVQLVEETPVSTAVSTSSKPKLDHTVDFNPLDYLYPDVRWKKAILSATVSWTICT